MNSPTDNVDPYLWLEEIDSPQVREWISARNAETTGALIDARFEADRKAVLDMLNADDRIPGGASSTSRRAASPPTTPRCRRQRRRRAGSTPTVTVLTFCSRSDPTVVA